MFQVVSHIARRGVLVCGAVGLAVLVLLVSRGAIAGEAVVLSTGMIDPWTNTGGSGFHQVLIREVFARMGMEAKVDINLASSRAFALANEGVTDGLAGRVAGIEKDYPNLIRVPERMFVNDFVACSRGAELPATWADLVPHSVAYIIGWQVFDHGLPQVRDLTLVKDSAQLLSLIKADRVEIILHERWQALWQAKFLGVTLHCQQTPLTRVDMYVYLNRRHADLVERTAAILRQMKADGSYDAIAQRVFGELGPVTTGLK